MIVLCDSEYRAREGDDGQLQGGHFEKDIILTCVRWYVAYPVSYRQLEEMMQERGVMDRKSKRPFFARAAAASPQPSARLPRAACRDTMLGAKAPGRPAQAPRYPGQSIGHTVRMGSRPSQCCAAAAMRSNIRPLGPLLSDSSTTVPGWPAVAR
jgi:hypothetical protein